MAIVDVGKDFQFQGQFGQQEKKPETPELPAQVTAPIDQAQSTRAAPSSPSIDPRDYNDLVNTVIAEAGGEGPEGMAAVTSVIKNRSERRNQGIGDVVRAPKQFEGYESPGAGSRRAQQDPTVRAQAEKIVNGVLDGTLPDVTGGADHFKNDTVDPDWSHKMPAVARIGGQTFYNSEPGAGDAKPIGLGQTKRDDPFAAVMPEVKEKQERDTATPDPASFLLTKLRGHTAEHISAMKPVFQDRLYAMFQAAPPNIADGLEIFSGARTRETQARLFKDAVAKYGSVAAARKWVAPPEGEYGSKGSEHNHGDASDLSYKGVRIDKAPKHVREWLHENAAQFGLKFPLSNEAWHIETAETRGGKPFEGGGAPLTMDVSGGRSFTGKSTGKAIEVGPDFVPENPLGLFNGQDNPFGLKAQEPAGALRPFNPDEKRPNPDGTFSTEITTTWQLPDGQWVNVPSLWMGPKGPVQFNADDEKSILGTMGQFEKANGPTFQRFSSVEEAETAAKARSAAGGAGSVSGGSSQFAQLDAKEPGRYKEMTPEEYAAFKTDFDAKQPYAVTDMARMVAGGVVKGVGQTIRGVGAMANSLAAPSIEHLINPIFGTDFKPSNPLAMPADWIKQYGTGVQQGVSQATKDAIAGSSPDGDILKPSTWTLGKNPSVRGYMALGLDVFGSMAPVVAGSILTGGGATSGMVLGGLQGGGAAEDTAREAIDEMAKQPGVLEKQSAYYREQIAAGKTRAQAIAATKDAAGASAFIWDLPVSAVGGAATAKIIHPASHILEGGSLATRTAGRAGASALEEGTQEVAETVATRHGINQGAGTDLNETDGTFSDFLLGALGGGVPGAIGGALSKGGEHAPAPESTDDTPAAPTQPERPKGPLARAAEYGAQQNVQKFVVRDGPVGDIPGSPIDGQTVTLAPDQAGVSVNMRRVVLPNGQTTEIGNNLLEGQSPRPMPAKGAAPDGAPKAGATVRVDAPGIEPFMGRVESYADGEAQVIDSSTGEVLQIPVASLTQIAKAPDELVADEKAAKEPAPVERPIITQGMRSQIEGMGYTPEAIRAMTPEQADDILKNNKTAVTEQTVPAAEPVGAERKSALPPESDQIKAASRPQGPPMAGERVIVQAPGVERFSGRIERWEDGENGPEAVVTSEAGTEMQVALDDMYVTKETAKQAEQEDLKANPPIEREKVPDAPEVRTVGGKQMIMPDPLHAQLFDLGKERLTSKRLLGSSQLDLDSAFPAKQGQLADKFGVTPQSLGAMADDYRYRVERAAKEARSELPINMHEVNAERLKKARADRVLTDPLPIDEKAEAEKQAKQAVATWWDSELDDDQRTNILARAGVKRSPKFLWKNHKPNIQAKLAKFRTSTSAAAIDAAAHEAATSPLNDRPEPTQAQKEAGNYALGHVRLGGMDISIENPAGSDRKGVDSNGKSWSVNMKSHYGYFKGTIGRDKDHIDTFVKPGTEQLTDASPIFVVDQKNPNGTFDEHKIMTGFANEVEARVAYNENYAKSWKGMGAVTRTTLGEFKRWLSDGDTTKPFAPQAEEATVADAPVAPATKGKFDNAAFSDLWNNDEEAIQDALARLAQPVIGGDKRLTDEVSRGGTDAELLAVAEKVFGTAGAGGNKYLIESRPGPKITVTLEKDEGDLRGVLEGRPLANALRKTFNFAMPEKTAAHPETQEPTTKKKAKAKQAPLLDRLENYFRPGRIVQGYSSLDKVLGFERLEDDRWQVRVVGVDAEGVPLANDRERVHATMPDTRELQKWERNNPVPERQKTDTIGQKADSVDASPDSADEASPVPADWGSANKLVSRDRADEIRAKLRAKLNGQISSGIDPEILALGTELAAFHIEAGARRFADFARAVAADMGVTVDKVRPFLRAWYNGARDLMEDSGIDIAGTDDATAVRSALAALKDEEPANGRSAKLDEPSPSALEGIPADSVQRAAKSGSPRTDAPRSGEPDLFGSEPVGTERIPARRSVADGSGKLPDPAGGRSIREADTGRVTDRPDAGRSSKRTADDADQVDASQSAATPAADRQVDYTISDADELGQGGAKAKFRNNVKAIQLLRDLEAANRPATRDEQSVLAKWVGWGGLRAAFAREDGSVTKGWEKEAAELKELLTPEEFRAAESSTKNAHYTSSEVVEAIWRIAGRLGFQGGQVLEPSVGAGNFLGLMPGALREGAIVTGVELDHITGGIAKNLYPAANIQAPIGFQDLVVPDGHFDLAIGNPPFGSERLYDKARPALKKFSIHNFFFAKSVDGLKPGGVLAMVVTNAFLDSSTASARKYISDRADLLGAIRLPNNAFAKNAGTEVTTDIILLQKREPGTPSSDASWVDVGSIKDKEGRTVPLNAYFVKNPDMMLGDFGAYGTMYRGDEAALVARPGEDLSEQLGKAMAKLPSGVMKAPGAPVVPENIAVPDTVETAQPGSMFLSPDGTVHLRTADSLGKAQSSVVELGNEKAKERVSGMIRIRDAFARLRRAQVDDASTDAKLTNLRKRLNDFYDGFTKKHGPINSDANKRLFRDDPTWPQISALEDGFDRGISAAVAKTTGETVRGPSARKAPIFTKRTQEPYKLPTSASSAKDALATVLADRGRVDIDAMSKLYGKSADEIVKELGPLLYKTPSGSYETADGYLSGNVKQKLAEAERAAETDSDYRRNIAALRDIIPADIEPVDIDVKPGSPWLPANHISDFVDHITAGKGSRAIYSPANARWVLTGDRPTEAAAALWGTGRTSVHTVLDAAMNGQAITVRDTLTNGSSVVNQAATDAANEKLERVKAEWKKWIWQDDARREQLGRLYNDTFNTDVLRVFDGSHLTLPGKVGDDIIELRPNQKNFVWRTLQTGTALADHVVGAGKTFALIASVMEKRRIGQAKKPLLTVPNHLVGQWAADFIKLYPGAKVLAATKKDFEAENRKRLFARIATGDWDAVIVAHSSFGKIGVSPEFEARFIREQMDDIEASITALRAATGEKSRNVAQLSKWRDNMAAKLQRLLDSGAKDVGLNFNELGVDALYVDELHEFKNLAFSTSMQRVAGLGNAAGSQKAADMYMKMAIVLERTGGQNVVTATGTPLSNTMAEMYTLQRYLDNKALKNLGVSHFDAWARVFGDVVTDWELSPSGQYKLNSRFARFVNMPELMQRYLSFADVITNDDIKAQLAAIGKKFPLPKVKGGKPQNVVVERSAAQARFIGEGTTDKNGILSFPEGSLVYRAEHLPKKAEKGGDNMLKVMSDARKAALDMRLIDASYPDTPGSKVHIAADNIRRIFDKWSHKKGTQLVFIDLSTPKKAKAKEESAIRDLMRRAEAGDESAQTKLDNMSPDEFMALDSKFSVYDDLKEKLIQRGIPESEIAFIHDANTDLQKEELFGKVRSGRIRVLLGSTPKMGAGTNVQNRLVALHHLDAPWRPSDLEQRDGRGIRQGNELYGEDPDGFEIEILRYATKNTLDARQWQTIEGKARFIQQMRKGGLKTREIEDIAGEAANSAEMKAAASGNPLILEEMDLRQKVRRLEGQAAEHDREQHRIVRRTREMTEERASLAKRMPAAQADAAKATAAASQPFSAVVNGETVEKPKEFGAALVAAGRAMLKEKSDETTLGNYAGFDLTMVHDHTSAFTINVEGAETHEVNISDIDNADGLGVAMRIINTVRKLPDTPLMIEDRIAGIDNQVPQLEKQLGPWQNAEQLDDATKRHREVLDALKPKTKPAASGAEGVKNSIADDEPVATINGDEVMPDYQPGEGMPALRRAAGVWYDKNLRGTTVTMADGTLVNFRQAGRNKAKTKGDMLLRSVPAIPHIIERGRVVERAPGDADHPNVMENIIIVAPVEVMGTVKFLAVSVVRTKDGQYHYDFTLDRDAGGPGSGARLADGANSADSLESTASNAESPGVSVPGGRGPKSGNAAVESASSNVDDPGITRGKSSQKENSGSLDATAGELNIFEWNPEINKSLNPDTAQGSRNTTERVLEELNQGAVGSLIGKLLAAGKVMIGTKAELAGQLLADGKIDSLDDISNASQGFTLIADNTIHLVSDNLQPGTATAVLLHEAFHMGGVALLKGATWQSLMKSLTALHHQYKRSGGAARQYFDAARSRLSYAADVTGPMSEELTAEELGAYAIEEYELAPASLKKWVDGAIGTVKAWLLHRFGRQIGSVTPAQLRALAIAALRDAAAGPEQSGPTYYRGMSASEAESIDKGTYQARKNRVDLYTTPDRASAQEFVSGSQSKGNAVLKSFRLKPGMTVISERQYDNMFAKFQAEAKARKEIASTQEFHDFLRKQGIAGVNGKAISGFKEMRLFNPQDANWDRTAATRNSIADNRVVTITQDKVINNIKGKLVDLQPTALKFVPLNYFTELAQPNMTAVDDYMRTKRALDAYRGKKQEHAATIAQRWLKYSRMGRLNQFTDKMKAAELARIMHNATLAGVDPAMTDDESRAHPDYRALRADFMALPPAARQLYTDVRDAYTAQAEELDSILLDNVRKAHEIAQRRAEREHREDIERINKARMSDFDRKAALHASEQAYAGATTRAGWSMKARLTKMRVAFESSRVQGPYFPLARHGRYFVAVKDVDGTTLSFSLRENAAERDRLAKEMAVAYPTARIEKGVTESKTAIQQAMDPRILAEIQTILGGTGLDGSTMNTVLDQIWQRYLETMPDLSTRKKFIHRKGTAGFDGDALRAFSSHMFHAAHQMGRLKYGQELQELTNIASDQANKSDDQTAGMTLANELAKRHEWVMNPTGSRGAQLMTSTAFVWFLAASPASALVNLSQTPMLGIPMLAGRFGSFTKAAAAIAKASVDSMRGKGSVLDANLSPDEKHAMQAFYDSGMIDKTQAHDLAGVGETGVDYSPWRAKIMGVVSWAFHKTEVWNREVTALAAYRMARAAGQNETDAINTAHDLTWKTHFDYSNSNRPAIMQNDFAKVALVFRTHNINMLYRVSRDVHQAVKGATPAARKEARYQLAGTMGMMSLLAGVTGTLGFNLAMIVAGSIFGDDDDPLGFENEFKKNVVDILGPELGGVVLNGVPGHYLGVDLTSRIGMPDFWFRSPSRELQGQDEANYWMLNQLGAGVSMIGNVFKGYQLVTEGEVARAVETIAPKAVKDLMKAYRYSSEGVLNPGGDEVIAQKNIDPWDVIAQAIGFTPAKVSETYERNNALKNAESAVLDKRRSLINAWALAAQLHDVDGKKEAIERIKRFNAKPIYRPLAIGADSLQQSLKTRARNAAKREDGALIANPRLGKMLREGLPERTTE